jgi:D-alanine transfer protein
VKKDLPHLLPALVAILIFIVFLAGASQYAIFEENRYIHAMAGEVVPESLTGSALQQAAIRQPDLLIVYGSSELLYEKTPFRAYQYFDTYPTGFMVFEIARAGATSLILAQKLAALGPELYGKKVVISFTPSMFNAGEVSQRNYDGNFSRLHGDALIFNPDLSFTVKQQAAKRMLDYPKTLKTDPILQFSVTNLANSSTINHILYYLSMPLGQLETSIIRLQDHWQVLSIIWSNPRMRPKVYKKPITIQWDAELAKAKAEQIALTSDDPYGIENSNWTLHYKRSFQLKEVPPGTRDAQFIKTLNGSDEWSDLEILLEILKEMGAQPLILSRPINGPLWQAVGVSQKARQVYYDRLHQIVVNTYRMPLVDFEDHDNDRYFSIDSSSHTSRLGWVYVDQTLDAFFHGNLH